MKPKNAPAPEPDRAGPQRAPDPPGATLAVAALQALASLTTDEEARALAAEAIRAVELRVLAAQRSERAELEQRHGQVWDTAELQAAFEVQGFMAPYVVVRRRSDGQVGSLQFQPSPRYYFTWKAHQ